MIQTKNMQVIGKGGFGTIRLEKDSDENDVLYALKENKLMNPYSRATYNELFKLRFLNQFEYKLCPKLVNVYNKNDTLIFKLQVYFYDLRGLQKKRVFDKCQLSQYFFVIEKVNTVVFKLHSLNLFHLDLKSSNVLVDETGQSVLCDFGMSQFDSHIGTCQIGTLAYEPPEILFNKQNKKIMNLKGIDLYGLGIIILEILFCDIVYKLKKGEKDVITENMKLAQVKVYGHNIIKMCQQVYQIDNENEAKQYILSQFKNEQNKQLATKYIEKEQINFEKILRTALILRFKQQTLQSQYKQCIDEFIFKVSKLLSCFPDERKDIQDCKIFQCDNYSITNCLPEQLTLDRLVDEKESPPTYFQKLFNQQQSNQSLNNFKICFEDILRNKLQNKFKSIREYRNSTELEQQLKSIIKM